MASVAAVMAELATDSTEQRRRIYQRHGAPEPQFGVKFADLRAMAKRLGTDQDLALGLWASGNTDARLLACMVADPARTSESDLDGWLAEIDYYVLVDTFVGSRASRVPGVRERATRWMPSSRDWTAQAGWDLVGSLAAADPELEHAWFLDRLVTIEREIGGAGNRTRHAMDGALIAIGIRHQTLQAAAMAAGQRIGTVVVDHGKTGCVTPDACKLHREDGRLSRGAGRQTIRPGLGQGGGRGLSERVRRSTAERSSQALGRASASAGRVSGLAASDLIGSRSTWRTCRVRPDSVRTNAEGMALVASRSTTAASPA